MIFRRSVSSSRKDSRDRNRVASRRSPSSSTPNAGHAIGISLEPGRIKAGLVNLVGEILERGEADVDTHDQRRTIASTATLIGELPPRSWCCAGMSARVWRTEAQSEPGPAQDRMIRVAATAYTHNEMAGKFAVACKCGDNA
jgi:hypothetical protein